MNDSANPSDSNHTEEEITQPENPVPALRQKNQKRVSVWQLLLLSTLLWLSCEEGIDSYVLKTLFLLALWSILRKRKVLPDSIKSLICQWCHPYDTRLRALHIRLIRRKETPPNHPETCTCLNCGHTYTGNFCNRCGQSRHTTRFHLRNVLQNIAGGFLNIDNGFGRTLLELLYRPGYMIADYIGGKRTEYFRPFQTLFILAALYVMTVQLVDPEALNRKSDSMQMEQEALITTKEKFEKRMTKTLDEKERKALAITINSLEKAEQKKSAQTALRDDEPGKEENFFDMLSKETMQTGKRLDYFIENSPFLQRVWNLLKSWGHGNKAFRIIATLPLFAIATRLAFYRRKRKQTYNTTEHLFIQAYIACQILLLSIIILPFNGHAQFHDLYELHLWFIFFLFCWDYKQLYRCSWWRSFWRTLLTMFYCFVCLFAFACLVMAMILLGAYIC